MYFCLRFSWILYEYLTTFFEILYLNVSDGGKSFLLIVDIELELVIVINYSFKTLRKLV